tara:strand:+ start:912 stop:1379 length:468 start_codon:yes stop_codon:yes gene_type:complete
MLDAIINNRTVMLIDDEVWTYRNNGRGEWWQNIKGRVNAKTRYRDYKIAGKYVAGHRLIYKLHNPEWDIEDNSKTNVIDHIDNNRINNNIENLRVVTMSQNQWNRKAKGYYWNKKGKFWQAQIGLNGKRRGLGTFKTEEEARQCYLDAKKKYHTI